MAEEKPAGMEPADPADDTDPAESAAAAATARPVRAKRPRSLLADEQFFSLRENASVWPAFGQRLAKQKR